MRIKKLIQSIGDRNLDMRERLFRLLALIGLCGLAAGMLNLIIIKNDIRGIPVLAVSFVFFCAVFYYSIHFQKIQAGAVIIAVTVIFVVMPFHFLAAGGVYGGGPIWVLFGLVYVCLMIEGKVKYLLLLGGVVVNSTCYYVAYAYSSRLFHHTMKTAYIDSGVSLLIVALLICAMMLFQNAIYRWENAIAKEKKQQIEDLSRAQNHFFSSMSHEIRTPINTIMGLNEMILREDVSEEVAEDAMSIRSASRMLLTLINDFLDMSKIESGKMDIVPVTYNVGAMLSDVVNMIWVRAKEKGLEFHVDVDRAVPAQLIGDEVRIKQILINVLNNAVKYTKTGSVTLSIQSQEDKSGYVQVSYSITDTGIGIKQESIPHLFTVFKRVDEESNRYIEGTGLGLSIVKQLVDLMGGDIAVNSVYTKGSTFVITLPQKVTDEETIGDFNMEFRRDPSARKHYKQSFEAPKARVLVVDDNETNLMVAEKLLRDTKVQIDTVTSGEECLKRTNQNRYDMILMDHLMPGMDGITCMHEIREQTGGLNLNTPVVVLTANAGGENHALYQREGFDGYLLKPVNGMRLEMELLKHLPREMVSITNVDGSVGVVESPVLEHRKKMQVMITTESVCDLPKELVEKYKIVVKPFRLRTEEGEFIDGVEAETDGILSYMTERGKEGRIVRSDEYDVSEYEEFFAEQLTKAQHIVHITMGKNLYHDFSHAEKASRTFDNITTVDSGHVTGGMALMVLQAAKYAAEGMSAEDIAGALEDMRRRVRTSFVVDRTEYLMRTGRMTPQLNRVCESLMIHPVLYLKNSDLKLKSIRLGSTERARRKYIHSMLNTVGEIDTEILFIAYTGVSKEELDDVKEQVLKKVEFQNVMYLKASSAISIHCGPGTISLCFMMK